MRQLIDTLTGRNVTRGVRRRTTVVLHHNHGHRRRGDGNDCDGKTLQDLRGMEWPEIPRRIDTRQSPRRTGVRKAFRVELTGSKVTPTRGTQTTSRNASSEFVVSCGRSTPWDGSAAEVPTWKWHRVC